MKNRVVIFTILLIVFSLNISLAGEQDAVNCKKQTSRSNFEKRAKKLAAEHCAKAKFKNLFISSEALTLDKDPAVASHLVSYECDQKKYLAVLQAIPENNCTEIQYQYIKADSVK